MNIELSILDWIQTLHTPFLDKIMVLSQDLGMQELYGLC